MAKNKHPFTKQDRHSVYEQLAGLDWSALSTELDGWKVGQKGYITITKQAKPKSREMLGYYYAVILPEAFKDFKTDQGVKLSIHIKDKVVDLPMSQDSLDWFLKLNYAEYLGEYKDKADMNMAECAAFETYVIKWLAEWRNVHIPLADPGWRER